MPRILPLLLLCALALAPANAAPPELLRNPGFEAPYGKQCCQPTPEYPPGTPIDEVQVAAGWWGWWREPRYPDYPPSCGEEQSPKTDCVAFHRPEWREAAPYQYRIRSGGNAQKYFTFYSVHEAGMYQTVEGVHPGQLLRFSVYLQAWSSGDGSLVSSGQDSMNLRVGIDPTGGADPFSPAIVWSAPGDSYDAFAPFSVDAVAASTRVTVFTYSRPVYPLQHNDVYVDDASLMVIGNAAGEATREAVAAASGTPPAPGRTPRPTALPYGQTIEYIVKPGDSLAVIAWRFGVTVGDIVALNGLSGTVVTPGQVLRVGIAPTPGVTASATSHLWDTPTPLPDGRSVYIVQPGDTLRLIAWHFDITPEALMALNGLAGDVLSVGQELVLGENLPITTPTASPTGAPSPSPAPAPTREAASPQVPTPAPTREAASPTPATSPTRAAVAPSNPAPAADDRPRTGPWGRLLCGLALVAALGLNLALIRVAGRR